jgi:hypothetical protein
VHVVVNGAARRDMKREHRRRVRRLVGDADVRALVSLEPQPRQGDAVPKRQAGEQRVKATHLGPGHANVDATGIDVVVDGNLSVARPPRSIAEGGRQLRQTATAFPVERVEFSRRPHEAVAASTRQNRGLVIRGKLPQTLKPISQRQLPRRGVCQPPGQSRRRLPHLTLTTYRCTRKHLRADTPRVTRAG